MCLGIPGEILEIDGHEALARFWNVEKTVRLDIVGETVETGDYVLNHAGFAIRKIPEEDVEETIAIYESFLDGDEDDALEEIGATEAVLEFGERPTAVSEGSPPVASDQGERRTGSTSEHPPTERRGATVDGSRENCPTVLDTETEETDGD